MYMLVSFSKVQSYSMELESRDMLSMMQNMSLTESEGRSRLPAESKLVIGEEGKKVPIQSTFEIKTCVAHKSIYL